MNSRDNLLLVMRQQASKYAVPAKNVEEILISPAVTALPQQPECLKGILNYKGRVISVLSLQTLSGCEPVAEEAVCVVLNIGDSLIALTAENAEALTADSGERMECDRSLMEGRLLMLDFVLPGTPPVFVLDLKKICEAAERLIQAADA